MAKKKAQSNEQEKANPDESNTGYFRRILKGNPKLLKARSNDEIVQRWLADHPGETEVPKKVKQSLFNTKTVLRKKRRSRRAPEEMAAAQEGHRLAPAHPNPGLESLEGQIDDCLSLAKNLDREGLESVIGLLRKARNEVVWKLEH